MPNNRVLARLLRVGPLLAGGIPGSLVNVPQAVILELQIIHDHFGGLPIFIDPQLVLFLGVIFESVAAVVVHELIDAHQDKVDEFDIDGTVHEGAEAFFRELQPILVVSARLILFLATKVLPKVPEDIGLHDSDKCERNPERKLDCVDGYTDPFVVLKFENRCVESFK